MNWVVVTRPQAEDDVTEAADWYDTQRAGLGDEFVEEILAVFDAPGNKSSSALPPASYQEHPLALSKAVPLSRHLRSDRRKTARDHRYCTSRSSA